MNADRNKKKKITFFGMGGILLRSVDIRFLFRNDFLSFLLLIILALVANNLFWFALGGGQTASSIIKGLIMWLLGLVITRCALTQRRGVDLLPRDRGALKSFIVMLAYQGLMYLIIAMFRAIRHTDAIAGMHARSEYVAILGFSLVIWALLGARFLSMSQLAWMSGHETFRIGQCREAMKGHAWSYCVWILVTYIPPVLGEFIVLTLIGNAPTDPRHQLVSGISGAMFFLLGVIICQNFSIRLFRALGLDDALRAGTGSEQDA